MRTFFAAFFGTLAALTVLVGAVAAVFMLVLAGLSTRPETPAAVDAGAWLVLDLADQFQDTPLTNEGFENLAEALGERKARVLQSRRVTRALEAAAADDDIAGLYLSGQDPALGTGAGLAGLKEIRDAIVAFGASGKPVRAWLTYAGTREYYLASAAGDLAVDPFGAILLPGLAAQPVFLAGAFEKFGIGVQVTRVGKYKSAIEPYTRTDMSPESREQTQGLLDDLWAEITRGVETSRKLETGTLQATVDREGLLRPEEARHAGLVDRIAYADEILEELREATGVRSDKESFKQIAMADYAALIPSANLAARRKPAAAEPAGHEKVAIVYAEGAIVDGSGSDKGVVWADNLSRQLRKLRHDDSVKAVVLRVNSPGGSVSASEAIGREVRLIQKHKPVVVSMGSVAASGGYWISTYADRIFAEPSTITGSIGVFSVLFNIEKLATSTLGLSFETVKTGRFADAMTITRPKTDDELAVLQESVDWVYAQFLSKVSESRGLQPDTVAEVAQGRVWSGVEAARIGLVDELGGLQAAVAFAAEKASVGEEFTVVEVPRPRRLVERLTEAFENKRREKATATLTAALVERTLQGLSTLAEFNDPRGIYARMPLELALP